MGSARRDAESIPGPAQHCAGKGDGPGAMRFLPSKEGQSVVPFWDCSSVMCATHTRRLTFFSQSPPILVYFETCGSALTGRRPAMMWKRPRRRTFVIRRKRRTRREALPTRSQGQVHRTTHTPQILQALRRPACFFSEPTLSSRFCFF